MNETARREASHPLSMRQGSEGYSEGMKIFPRLKEWENQIALNSLLEGKTIQDLREKTPFRQYLGVARRAHLAGERSVFNSFTTLFNESPGIDMLVSLGNFHTIHSLTRTLAGRYPAYQLPLGQFFQDALYRIAPYSARNYDPAIGNPFGNYLSVLLKKRFLNFVSSYQLESTAPIQTEKIQQNGKGRPAERRTRARLASLDAQMQRVETPQTLFEYVETLRQAPQETTNLDDQDATDKIHLLSRLAGLNAMQEETLIALFVYGGTPLLIAQLRNSTTRSVRGQRQTAIEKIQQLGFETVSSILAGTPPSQKR